MDICRHPAINLQRGFIVTPRYPNNYANELNCLTTITVDPSQKINLTIIDMDLEINGTYGCFDWMYAFNQYRSVTLCGKRSNEKLSSLQTNEISIRFQSNSKNTRKGFWMYYEGRIFCEIFSFTSIFFFSAMFLKFFNICIIKACDTNDKLVLTTPQKMLTCQI